VSGHGYNRAPQTRRLGGLPNQTLSPVRHNLLTSLARNENKLFRIRSSRLHFVGHVIGPSWKGEVQSCFFYKATMAGVETQGPAGLLHSDRSKSAVVLHQSKPVVVQHSRQGTLRITSSIENFDCSHFHPKNTAKFYSSLLMTARNPDVMYCFCEKQSFRSSSSKT